ncbi:UDP-glycosyltransferase 85K12 [Cinnamomum micranthum f. kanehirae]|uniref:UDP-glycosyltransferase 85K12 n=1 Tax=Cinnamomum micranthum f. kanehirae TaxID=337451 RepID=A0A443PAI5_9MAGN|nr:UDP-glycosyltransferase 85K12 [Cinnamomum micranthum f. kanehirae]
MKDSHLPRHQYTAFFNRTRHFQHKIKKEKTKNDTPLRNSDGQSIYSSINFWVLGVKDQKRWKRKGERYIEEMKKPHVVCIPAPAQGHINPVMQLAKLLYSRGFFITFVSTDFTHRCQGQESLEFLDGFALNS